MTEKPEPSKAESAAQSGVFGNLPDARPGTRSPRRTSAAKAKTQAKPAAKAATKAKPKPKRPTPTETPKAKASPAGSAPPPPRAAEPQSGGQPQPGGLADVAWAGIAVAAEAATIGVRLASRAIEAVRGTPERD